MLFNHAELNGFFSVKCLRLTDENLGQVVGHVQFELKEHFEKLAAENSEVLLFQKLGVDLGKRIKLGINLILGDRALVANEGLQLTDFFLVFSLQVFDVLLRNLHVTLKLQNIDQELTLVSKLILVVLDQLISSRLG